MATEIGQIIDLFAEAAYARKVALQAERIRRADASIRRSEADLLTRRCAKLLNDYIDDRVRNEVAGRETLAVGMVLQPS